MYPIQIIAAFDEYLAQNNLQFTAIVVGGCWVKDLDGNPLWPSHVKTMFEDLAKGLGYEF